MSGESFGLHYFQPSWVEKTDRSIEVDVCVYGGTAGGVVAAVAATRRGKSAAILQPGNYLGGMTTGGLGETDFGKKAVIGGMAAQFYRDLGKHYGRDEEWKFEPSAAQKVIDGYARDANVAVHYRQYLDAVEMDGQRIVSVRMLGGLRVRARVFIDATYEGDLLAKAGVTFTVGREPNSRYGETVNGVQVRDTHQFSHVVDPFVVEGDPSSGTLPFINTQDAAPAGSGDGRLQAYNFRVCMTDDPTNRVAWRKPEPFDPRLYLLATRWFNGEKDRYNEQVGKGGRPHDISKFDRLCVGSKTDTNNHGPVSSDFIGANYTWPEGDYAERERVFQAHVAWQQGLYWFLANDPSVPQRYRDAYSQWGLARDEFADTDHWPHQLYVREARRMVSDDVLNEHDTQHHRQADDPVGMGSYNMDSHNCQRFIRLDERTGRYRVLNEGDVQLPPKAPYRVSYRSIVPRVGECVNLLVPTCLSSSHIAYGSVRMEPVFMVLGESAAIAGCLAIDAGVAVQDVPYTRLGPELEKAQQVLSI
jgi:hypothetical protein